MKIASVRLHDKSYKSNIAFAGKPDRLVQNFFEAWNRPSIRNEMTQYAMRNQWQANHALGRHFFDFITKTVVGKKTNSKAEKTLMGFFKTLKQAHPKQIEEAFKTYSQNRFVDRANLIKQILDDNGIRLPRNSNYLDIGAGDGKLTRAVATKLGIVNATGIDVFDANSSVQGVTLKKFDGVNIPLASNSQDFISMISILHHADKPKELLAETRRVLKPNGALFVRDFNNVDRKDFLLSETVDYISYRLYSGDNTVPIHAKYLPFTEWINMFKDAGFKVKKTYQRDNETLKPFMAILKK